MSIDRLLYEYVLNDASLLYLKIDKAGIIVETNNFTVKLIGHNLAGTNFKDIIIDFNKSFNISELTKEKVNNVILNVKTISGIPSTYYFKFIETNDFIIAIGEANNLEIEMLKSNLLQLNKEHSNLSREVQKKNSDLHKLNEQKNYFLGIAAHDLRNPIGIIMGFSEFLLQDLEGKLSEKEIKMLKVISTSSEFMLRMLNELLDISKIESGKLILDLEDTNLVELIRGNVELNSSLAEKKDILIFFYCHEDIPEVNIDPVKIEQVLNNLISNAIKYSAQGTKIKVNIFLSGEYVTVSVEDEGQGIPEDEIINVFKPFATTSVKSTSGEKSTGLGLAIVQKIVLGHKGKIWVKSKVGVGTTFYFSLPLSKH